MGVYRNYTPKPVTEVVMETKKCTICKEIKPAADFYKNRTKKDGYSDRCKECSLYLIRKYYKEHKDQYLEYQRKYREEHKEYQKNYQKTNFIQLAAKKKKYAKKNIEHIKKYQKEYFQSEQGKAAIARGNHKRRTFLKDSINDLTSEQWEEIKKSQNYACLHCGRKEPEIKLTRDCIVPVSKGGRYTKSNIQGLCRSCNSKKKISIDSIGFQKILGGK